MYIYMQYTYKLLYKFYIVWFISSVIYVVDIILDVYKFYLYFILLWIEKSSRDLKQFVESFSKY